PFRLHQRASGTRTALSCTKQALSEPPGKPNQVAWLRGIPAISQDRRRRTLSHSGVCQGDSPPGAARGSAHRRSTRLRHTTWRTTRLRTVVAHGSVEPHGRVSLFTASYCSLEWT